MPAWIPAAIGAGASLIGGLFQNRARKKANQQSQQFAREMYNKQYQDSLTFWEKQNLYNTPASQKQRLIDANLSPAFMYAKSGAGGSAGNLNVPDTMSAQFEPGNFDPFVNAGANAMQALYDFRIKKKQASVLDEQIRAKELDNIHSMLKLPRAAADAKIGAKMSKLSHDAAVSKLNLLRTDEALKSEQITDLATRGIERKQRHAEILKQLPIDTKIKSQILRSRELRNKMDTVISGLMQDGFNMNDPAVVRFLVQLANNYFK